MTRTTVTLRVAALAGMTLVSLALVACGGDDSSASLVDGAAPDGGCAPRTPARWAPTWRPPRATLHACTDTQIETQFRLCDSEATYSASECAVFKRDPANAACRQCLYATEDERSYGPLVYLANRILRINVPGCLALADGNLAPTGCGAQMQALEACSDVSCISACTAYDDFATCVTQADDTVCRSYRVDSSCGDPATYALCLGYATFDDYFRGVAKLFCGAGFPGGGAPDGGVPDGGILDGGALDDSSASTAAPAPRIAPARGAGVPIRRRVDRARESQVPRAVGEGVSR